LPDYDSDTGTGGAVLGGLGCILVLVIGLAQVVAALDFLVEYWGWHWIFAVLAVGLLLTLRLTILVVLPAFFGAWLVWDWHPIGAFAFALPGLAIALAALAAGGVADFLRNLSRGDFSP